MAFSIKRPERAVLEQLIISLAGVLGGGTIVHLYDRYLSKKASEREWLQTQLQWISDQHQRLLKVREEESEELRRQRSELEKHLKVVEARLADAITEIIKLGGTWPNDD